LIEAVTPRHGRALSIAMLLLAVLTWGGTYVVTKTGVEELPPMLFALLRFVVAALVLVPLAVLRGGMARLPRPTPWRTLVLMGLTGVGLYYTGFNLALTFTTASQGALVQSSIPAVTAIMAMVWLRERLSPQRIFGIVLAVAGVLLIVARTSPDVSARSPRIGNLLMFGTVLVWGVYTILAKRVADVDVIAVTAVVAVVGTVILIPAALIEAVRTPLPAISAASWLRVLYLGALASAVGYMLYGRALRDLDASLVGAFVNLAPVIGVVSGVVLLGEAIAPVAILGGVLVLLGVWLSSRQATTRFRAGKD
jgi:drug/metabolite transporter (DMT)-like permease